MIRRLPTHQWIVDAGLAFVYVGIVAVLSGPYPGGLIPAVAYAGALAVRRLSPGLSLGAAWVGAVLQMTVSRTPGVVDLAVLGVLYASAAYGDRAVRAISLGSVFVGAIVATSWLTFTQTPDLFFSVVTNVEAFGLAAQYFLALLAIFASSWLLGQLRRTLRRADANARARVAAERDVAVEQERTAIARDMHDVVAHSLAVVIAQADGARFRAADEDPQLAAALGIIAQTARSALGEVRGLLGRLRQREDDGPQPGLIDLARLVDDSREAGLAVRLDVAQPLPPVAVGTQLAVYRIVQEALTNALRHGDRERPVVVGMTAATRELQVTVASGVRSPSVDSGRADGGGEYGASATGCGRERERVLRPTQGLDRRHRTRRRRWRRARTRGRYRARFAPRHPDRVRGRGRIVLGHRGGVAVRDAAGTCADRTDARPLGPRAYRRRDGRQTP